MNINYKNRRALDLYTSSAVHSISYSCPEALFIRIGRGLNDTCDLRRFAVADVVAATAAVVTAVVIASTGAGFRSGDGV